MNLEQFLVYVHFGAYEVTKQLLLQELSTKDRTVLRLVSRAINNVVLDFPIVWRLHISTHEADLECLELLCKNERLLRQVDTLQWDHSIHDFLLLHGGMHTRLPTFNVEWPLVRSSQEGEAPTKRRKIDQKDSEAAQAFAQWAKLAKGQHMNLLSNRDFSVITRALPMLQNVKTITFRTENFFLLSPLGPRPTWSPALKQWWKIPSTLKKYMPPPYIHGWQNVGDKWFSRLTVGTCPEILYTVFPSQAPDVDIWSHLPIRGIKFFERLASTAAGSYGSNGNINVGLRQFFPRLIMINASHFLQQYLQRLNDNPELDFLRASTEGVSVLDLSVTGDGSDNSFNSSDAVKSLILSGSSLRLLRLTLDPSACDRMSVVSVIVDILPSLPQLSDLELEGEETSFDEIKALGECISRCPSMQSLSLSNFYLRTGEWSDVLIMWKKTQCLEHLYDVRLEQLTDYHLQTETDGIVILHGYYYSRDEFSSGIVDWLEGIGPYPLIIERY